MKSKKELIEDTEQVRNEIVALVRALDGANNRLFAALNRLERDKLKPNELVKILEEIKEDPKFISLDREEAVHDIRGLITALIAELENV